MSSIILMSFNTRASINSIQRNSKKKTPQILRYRSHTQTSTQQNYPFLMTLSAKINSAKIYYVMPHCTKSEIFIFRKYIFSSAFPYFYQNFLFITFSIYSELSILRTPDITNISILRTKLCSPSFSP